MEAFLIRLAINFALNQLAGYGESIDWKDVATKFESRARGEYPAFAERAVDACIVGLVDTIADVMKETVILKGIINDLMSKDWATAESQLVSLVEAALQPAEPAVEEGHAA